MVVNVGFFGIIGREVIELDKVHHVPKLTKSLLLLKQVHKIRCLLVFIIVSIACIVKKLYEILP